MVLRRDPADDCYPKQQLPSRTQTQEKYSNKNSSSKNVEILEAKNIALKELVARYKRQEEEQQKAKLNAMRDTVLKQVRAQVQDEIASLHQSFSSFKQ